MVMSIYTLTDAIVIGKGVGPDALAALSITTPLLCILMAMGILFGVGGSVQMSVHWGTGDYQKANRFFTLSFATLAVFSNYKVFTFREYRKRIPPNPLRFCAL